MELPEYVSTEEVRRVCRELGIRDWSALTDSQVLLEEATTILGELDLDGMEVPVLVFQKGLEVELEHGTRFKNTNVTNNHPLLTGKIVLAHLYETMDYYERLDVAELEADLFKAVKEKNLEKITGYNRRLAKARLLLVQSELEHL